MSRDEAPAVYIAWGESRLCGLVDVVRAEVMHIVTPVGSVLPEIGTPVQLIVGKDSGSIRFASVVSVDMDYGTLNRVELQLGISTPSNSTGVQRRANSRFHFSPAFPLFCFVKHPHDRRFIPLRALDVSNGGVSFSAAAENAASLPKDVEMDCLFQAPSIGRFRATIVVRDIRRRNDRGDKRTFCRVAAEFIEIRNSARRVIARCLARPLSGNSLQDLVREGLFCSDWPEFVEVRATDSANTDGAQNFSASLLGHALCNFRVDTSNVVSYEIVSNLVSTRRMLKVVAKEISRGKDRKRRLMPANLTTKSFRRPAKDHEVVVANGGHYVDGSYPTRIRNLPEPDCARRAEVQWAEYAQAYDVMCASNPAYQENLSLFRDWINSLELPPSPNICDVGAGTGNYVVELAERYPNAIVTHVDSDPVMNRTAFRKYRARGLSNISFRACLATDAAIDVGSVDLIACVNALYSFPDAERAISAFHSWLRPHGYLFIIDLGRPMDVADWSRYIVRSSLRNVGFAKTLRAFAKGRKAIGQNRRIRREQDRGVYWLHTGGQLRSVLEAVGFKVTTLATCYRDVCDLAICRKQ
jgi:ubiquinone/menaquinone biosynthesis C-methylase UbiE/c-di-GMP-binding flagellar brake protein YcgR